MVDTRGTKTTKSRTKKQNPPAKKARAPKNKPPPLWLAKDFVPVAKMTYVAKLDNVDALLEEALASCAVANGKYANSTRHTKSHGQKRERLIN